MDSLLWCLWMMKHLSRQTTRTFFDVNIEGGWSCKYLRNGRIQFADSCLKTRNSRKMDELYEGSYPGNLIAALDECSLLCTKNFAMQDLLVLGSRPVGRNVMLILFVIWCNFSNNFLHEIKYLYALLTIEKYRIFLFFLLF